MNTETIMKNWWDKVKDVSPEKVLNEMKLRWEKFKLSPQLKKVWDKIVLMYELAVAVVKGEYKGMPTSKTALIIGALAYLVLPLDLVPDYIPFVGWMDDVVVLTWVFTQCRSELERYRKSCKDERTKGRTDAFSPAARTTIDVPCDD